MDGAIAELMNGARTEIFNISGELDLQTEKLKGVQQKLGINKTALDNNWTVLNKLKKSTEMTRIIKTIVGILLTFCILYATMKYASLSTNYKEEVIKSIKRFQKAIKLH